MQPSYWDDFKCLADKCEFTCCQEWKIAVDEDTRKKWEGKPAEQVTDDHGALGKFLTDYTGEKDGTAVVRLNGCGKCHFLNDEKLCNLVCKYGEDFISETCHTFPREWHVFDDHTENNLVLCCPYVIDLLNEHTLDFKEEYSGSGLFHLRQKMMEYVADFGSQPLEEKLLSIFYILLECEANNEDDTDLWTLIPELRNSIENMNTDWVDKLNECNELMLDLSENYRKENLYKDILLELCAEAEDLEQLLSTDDLKEEKIIFDDFLETWKQYEELLGKVMVQEFYGELILPESDIESFLVKYQWIMMEYVFLRHLCYLYFRKNRKLDYDILKKYMVLTFRMMGYDEDDIYEYLENSFEDIIWQWGYLALIC